MRPCPDPGCNQCVTWVGWMSDSSSREQVPSLSQRQTSRKPQRKAVGTLIITSTVSLSAPASRFCPPKGEKNVKIWDLCLISRPERFLYISMSYKCQRQAGSLVMAAVSDTPLLLVEDPQHLRLDKCCSIVPAFTVKGIRCKAQIWSKCCTQRSKASMFIHSWGKKTKI